MPESQPVDDGEVFTPTTEEVMAAYRLEPPRPYTSFAEGVEEFHRWLAAIRADAFDEGVIAKSNSNSILDRDVLAKNPYRITEQPSSGGVT